MAFRRRVADDIHSRRGHNSMRSRESSPARRYSESKSRRGRNNDFGKPWQRRQLSPDSYRRNEDEKPFEPAEQKWKIKDTSWKSGNKPTDSRDSGTLQPIISPYALEDPMYEYIQQKRLREKRERIQQLQALLDSSTTSSDSDDSDRGKMKKKKRKKKKKKHKHSEDDTSRNDSSKRRVSASSSPERKVLKKTDSKDKKNHKKVEKSHKKKKRKDKSDAEKVVWEEKVVKDEDIDLFKPKTIKQEIIEADIPHPNVSLKPDPDSIDIFLKKVRSQTENVNQQNNKDTSNSDAR